MNVTSSSNLHCQTRLCDVPATPLWSRPQLRLDMSFTWASPTCGFIFWPRPPSSTPTATPIPTLGYMMTISASFSDFGLCAAIPLLDLIWGWRLALVHLVCIPFMSSPSKSDRDLTTAPLVVAMESKEFPCMCHVTSRRRFWYVGLAGAFCRQVCGLNYKSL